MRSRLFRHDYRIAINIIRGAFSAWHDRLLAAIMLIMALAAIRSWITDCPWTIGAWAAFGMGIMAGGFAGRLIAARSAFHGFDGVLAADALHPATRRRYAAAWHSIGVAFLTMVALIARPSLLIVSVAAYGAGMLLAGLIDGVRGSQIDTGRKRAGWMLRSWLRRPVAGIGGAGILLVLLPPASMLGRGAAMVVACIATVSVALLLTLVDDATVRFMTLAGHGSRSLLAYYGKAMASFVAIAVPGSWLVLGSVAAGAVAAASGAMLILLTLRILAYRLHGKQFADFLVSVLVGLLMLTASFLPIALPVVAALIVWHLHGRGRAKTWLVA
ncbi:hypothetical protein [Sphingomonas abietis]|uniref:Uncharacterized protein n=1 Tax=Sphingomonas abietis TaxID=3012344 RepID=A0ABY7NLE1_9SPHN|nr:hypothetical protein [Sphingomonas abietis]WBO20729.1 hypothetical protein PBT88_10935 [Sphingomonas abietis]